MLTNPSRHQSWWKTFHTVICGYGETLYGLGLVEFKMCLKCPSFYFLHLNWFEGKSWLINFQSFLSCEMRMLCVLPSVFFVYCRYTSMHGFINVVAGWAGVQQWDEVVQCQHFGVILRAALMQKYNACKVCSAKLWRAGVETLECSSKGERKCQRAARLRLADL